jgi:hypothetical protein
MKLQTLMCQYAKSSTGHYPPKSIISK